MKLFTPDMLATLISRSDPNRFRKMLEINVSAERQIILGVFVIFIKD